MTPRREWRYCDNCRDYHDARNPSDTCTAPVIVPPLAAAVAFVLGLALAVILWRWWQG